MGDQKAIIIDNGSGIIKAGFATDQTPKCILRNSIARPKTGDPKKDFIIGAENDLNKLSITYPMEHGVIMNWDDMEKIWNYIYGKNQLSAFPEEHPVLLTETACNPRNNRERIMEIFYEKYKVPALYISLQAVLSLYSTGRTTGMVLDVGDTVSHAVPIYQGFAMPNSVRRIDIGGRDVTKYFQLLLKKEGISLQSSGDTEVIQKMKESICYLAESPIIEESNKLENIEYTLPDGKSIYVNTSRFRAPEALFRPSLIGKEYAGVHEILHDAIQSSDLDLRKTLIQNIVISGGSTLFKGFGKRLFTEMKNVCPKDVPIKIAAPKERLYSAWIGGSILARMPTFKDMYVTKQDYYEKGKSRVFNKKLSNVLLDQYYFNLHTN